MLFYVYVELQLQGYFIAVLLKRFITRMIFRDKEIFIDFHEYKIYHIILPNVYEFLNFIQFKKYLLYEAYFKTFRQ